MASKTAAEIVADEQCTKGVAESSDPAPSACQPQERTAGAGKSGPASPRAVPPPGDVATSSGVKEDDKGCSSVDGCVKLDCDEDAEKSSMRGSVKDSSVSAKFSDGTSSLTKASGSTKVSGHAADFVPSGKSSVYRPSAGSDVSDDSTCSSICSSASKPHKSNDSRWEAIQAVRTKEGSLGLSHFRLLKRLGCGDIGSVYLSELSGTKCYFAMKIMDKASLAGRKKLLRAQTEREILQCLDHPFLPTLYTHFETDKFSCLVMEFCPGGDLHTLRQKQPGKFFPEQAAK
jgi:hypothetical protein